MMHDALVVLKGISDGLSRGKKTDEMEKLVSFFFLPILLKLGNPYKTALSFPIFYLLSIYQTNR